MGQGRDQEALTICQLLSRSGEPQLRQQSPPVADDPRSPVVGPSGTLVHETSPLSSRPVARRAGGSRRRRSRKPQPPPPPPTGPTRPPALDSPSWSPRCCCPDVVLSGCVRMQADLIARHRIACNSSGKSRAALTNSSPGSNGLTGSSSLFGLMSPWSIPSRSSEDHHRSSAIAAFRSTLTQMLQLLSNSAGIDLPTPRIRLVERNWLVGVQQRLLLELDLEQLPDLPGFELSSD
ncbi:MAG: hypothetical protein CM15mP77_3400 [Synechococcus sp.]|nr:MAG: hypothetical protein CM15mP77_3400 [Synechococcus sp.]